MNIETFSTLAARRFIICLEMLTRAKHREYTRCNDKLHNFKVAGAYQHQTPEKALWGMMIKQFISLEDIVNDIEEFGKLPEVSLLEEKVSDIVNYFILLEALVVERKEGRTDVKC